MFFRLLTNQAPVLSKIVFFVFLMEHYFHCFTKVHLINLSLVQGQIYCQMYIPVTLQAPLRAALPLAGGFGKKALFS